MQEPEERSQAQLEIWATRIRELEAKALAAGTRARFDDLVGIDELKALYALVQAKFDALSAAGDSERASLRAEIDQAWDELAAGFKSHGHEFKRWTHERRAIRGRRRAQGHIDP